MHPSRSPLNVSPNIWKVTGEETCIRCNLKNQKKGGRWMWIFPPVKKTKTLLALFDSLIIFAKLLLCDILLFSTTGNFFHIKMTWKLIGGAMWHPQLSPLYGSVLVRLHVDFQIWPNLTNPTCDTQRRSDFLTPAETQTPWFSLTLVSRSQGKHKMATRKEENKYKTENNSKKSKPCAPFCQ